VVEWKGVDDIGRSFWSERAIDMLTCHKELGTDQGEIGEFSSVVGDGSCVVMLSPL
jgi:hypothetical protein